MANNVRVQEALSHALKACPAGPGVLAELRTAVELAARKARSNRGLAGARADIQEALRLLKQVDEDAATSVRSALRDALAYMEGRAVEASSDDPEPEEPAAAEATEPERRPRRQSARRPAERRRPSGARRPRGGGRRSRRMPAEQASEASPIEAVLERSADGTTTIRVALRPGDLRALVREVLG